MTLSWPMTHLQWLAAVAASVLIVVILTAIILPHPEVWERMLYDPDYPRAALTAYRIALGTDRPSGVPLNAITYTFLIASRYPNDIEVVFVARWEVRRLLPGEPAESIQVVLRRPDMRLVSWTLQDD
jgi:hypothetical protein